MRIAVIADIHANLPAFQAVLHETARLECAAVIHLGDLISIGPYPAECVDLAVEQGVDCVLGNHEEWILKGLPPDPLPNLGDEELMHQHWTHSRLDKARRDWIRSWPYRIDRHLDGVRVTFLHFALDASGSGFRWANPRGPEDEILERFGPIDSDLVCFGHLHERFIDREFGGTRFLNPGAAGCSREPRARFSTVELSQGRYTISHHRAGYEAGDLFRRYEALEIPAREFIAANFFGRSAQHEQATVA